MKIKVFSLGSVCEDLATGLMGTLTHWLLTMDQKIEYLFQPKGLDENGQPLEKVFMGPNRLMLKEGKIEEVDVPFEILGTIVTDKASGFTGMAIEFVRHLNGCFHVIIQPRGVVKKTKNPIKKSDFDLRGCTGEKIIELSEKEKEESQKKNPSPSAFPEREFPA